ncbi:unnamed protein product [Lupinus luteus]|uniref:Uncharacterized protein n=1 Tax=Lupinus luteus TaxID=3873 RepID=A0AAV1WRZ6_LUPLU
MGNPSLSAPEPNESFWYVEASPSPEIGRKQTLLEDKKEKDTRIFVEKARAELPLIPLDEAESPGRLAYTTDSGAGKRRVFAIGNFIFQRTLRPLNDFIMKVLRRIPMDGTFDQVRPLDHLRSSSREHGAFGLSFLISFSLILPPLAQRILVICSNPSMDSFLTP